MKLPQISSLNCYMFDVTLNMEGRDIKDQSPWCMLFADRMVMCSTRREQVERKLEEWRGTMKE